MPFGKALAKIWAALLILAIGSAADVLSTWRCSSVLEPHEGHEANVTVMGCVYLLAGAWNARGLAFHNWRNRSIRAIEGRSVPRLPSGSFAPVAAH